MQQEKNLGKYSLEVPKKLLRSIKTLYLSLQCKIYLKTGSFNIILAYVFL